MLIKYFRESSISQGDFIHIFEEELKQFEGNSKHFEWINDRKRTIEAMSVINKIINEGNFSCLRDIVNLKNEYGVLTKNNTYCVAILILIDKWIENEFSLEEEREIRDIYIPAILLFNGNVLVDWLSTIPKDSRILR